MANREEQFEAFLSVFWHDVAAGSPRDRSEYLLQYPGIENLIDAEIEAFLEQSASRVTPISSVTAGENRSRLAPKLDLRSGRIGRYRLIEEIGRGGQGIVYLAADDVHGRDVAIKLLLAGLGFSPASRARFEAEARFCGRLDHPGIARIYDSGREAGVSYIVMEHVRGRSLRSIIVAAKNERQVAILGSGSGSSHKSILEAAWIIEQTSQAVHVAHQAGLVHRDIKPGNIMIRDDGSPCLLDFGLAREEDSEAPTLTQEGAVLGTPGYMPPEQLESRRGEVGPSSDVYSLGITLFECCTLERPFIGRTEHELREAVLHGAPFSPRRINPRIPRDLAAIILTAIDRDPKRRYLTALALAEDLGRFRNHQPVHARRAGFFLVTGRWVRRNAAVTMVAGTILLLLSLTAMIYRTKEAQASRESMKASVAAGRAHQESRRAEEALALVSHALSARDEALREYERLADVKRIESLRRSAADLVPPSPVIIAALEAWQREASALEDRLPGQREFLQRLRAKAFPYTEADRRRELAEDYDYLELAQSSLAALDGRLKDDVSEELRKALRRRRAAISLQQERLESHIASHQVWQFADQNRQLQHDIIERLVIEMERFAHDESGPVKSIARRLKAARAIRFQTIDASLTRWTDCRRRILENPRYAGLDLTPQLGLIPLGPDPFSGLEEFLHWMSHDAETPARNSDGRWTMSENLGIILVLVPGGVGLVGSQATNPNEPNFDRDSQEDEFPVHAAGLDPFFLSKFEMTQAQWERTFHFNPAFYKSSRRFVSATAEFDGLHPVENLTWDDLMLHLPEIGLSLPTEAEWECAARSGTSGKFAGSTDLADLAAVANIAGEETAGQGWMQMAKGLRDSWIWHAPVGALKANAFGFHDMSGNVAEWCLDGASSSYLDPSGPRGLKADPALSVSRILRGGSFMASALRARVSYRLYHAPGYSHGSCGVRPARMISE